MSVKSAGVEEWNTRRWVNVVRAGLQLGGGGWGDRGRGEAGQGEDRKYGSGPGAGSTL